jgi:hypothetical protein
MKITVVTDQRGNLVGTIRGHKLSEKNGNLEAGVFLSPGHNIHHIDVDDALGKLTDADDFHARVTKHMAVKS